MSVFHPSTQPNGIENSEAKIWNALKLLDQDWQVFHSVTWQSIRNGREGDGEADFILLHPRHGIVVIEVKGGTLRLQDGQWTSTGRRGVFKIKDPFRQATASKHALLRFLNAIPELSHIPRICHGIATPDWPMPESSVGMHPKEIVIDTTDRSAPGPAIKRLLQHWNQWEAETLPKKELRRISHLLAPKLTARRAVGSAVADSEAELIRLTNTQIAALRMLRLVRRCVIVGGAGTGKTLLALEKARALSETGARTLLLCYNQPLSHHLKETIRDCASVTTSTFHALCLKLARAKGRQIPNHTDNSWFDDKAADFLADIATDLAENERYDALVIDEAQDFCDSWLTAAQLLLREPDESPLFLFLDRHQELYRKQLRAPSDWQSFPLDRNCRNTKPIAELVAKCFSDSPPDEGAEGVPPSFVEADDLTLADVTTDVVFRLLDEEGLDPGQMVVLTNTRKQVLSLRSRSVGPAVFTELGRTGVVVETVHRFKGLEAATVVLSLSGRPSAENNESRSLTYVGASRARGALVIVATRPWIRWIKKLP